MGNYFSQSQSVTHSPQRTFSSLVPSPSLPPITSPKRSVLRVTLDASTVTPSKYDHLITLLTQTEQTAERIKSYLIRDRWIMDGHPPTGKKMEELTRLIRTNEDKLSLLLGDAEVQRQKIAAMELHCPEVIRRHPFKKRITLSLCYRGEVYSVDVDINDSMNTLFATFCRPGKFPLPLNPLLIASERFRLYQKEKEAVFPSQRWLIPYEAQASFCYDVVILPLTPEQKEDVTKELRHQLQRQEKITNMTDEELVADFDEWFVRDTSVYTKSDASRMKRYVSAMPSWEPGQKPS